MGGCNCGRAKQLEAMRVHDSQPSKNGYKLSSYPDCTERYTSGPYLGLHVFVVGRNTPYESVFHRRELEEASAYAKTLDFPATIEQLETVEVCRNAVEDAYARL